MHLNTCLYCYSVELGLFLGFGVICIALREQIHGNCSTFKVFLTEEVSRKRAHSWAASSWSSAKSILALLRSVESINYLVWVYIIALSNLHRWYWI